MISKLPAGSVPLTETEFARLAGFLGGIRNPDALTIEGLDGFFCALIAGPDLVLPSEYLPVVWGGELPDENAFENEAEAQALIGLMMRHWNAIIAEYETEMVYLPRLDAPDERGVPGRRWAQGFMRGVQLRRHSWVPLFTDENEGQLMSIALVAGEVDPAFPQESLPAEKTERLESMMGAGAGRAYWHFAEQRRAGARATREAKTMRREIPKVGRNEPCPCSSGRKFKQCCGGIGRE